MHSREYGDHKKTQQPRARVWTVARIVDYRLQCLEPFDPEDEDLGFDWADLSEHTFATTDREKAYQTARANDGLLISAAGLPTGGRMLAFQRRVQSMQSAADAPRRAQRQAQRELPRATGDPSRQYRPATPSPAGDDDLPY